MATATIAKSEMRKNNNIVFGYGEVPGVENEETGEVIYGLPGGHSTQCENKALAFAQSLDKAIRANLKSTNQLLRVA